MSKQFIAVIAIIIIVFVGIFAISSHKSSNGSGSSASTLTEHTEGQGKDGVTLVEYGDYQCPYCGEYYSTVKQVQSQYSQQITFQFRNFPLVSIHQNAFAGARAAEAAALQGKFWQMHDLLYEQNQLYYNSGQKYSTWIGASDPTTYFDQYAQQLGLNVTQFKSDYSSTKVNDLITADMNEGNSLGIDATPTFILDGKQISVNNSVSAFDTVINAAIAQKAHKS
jgi:protein-disulfide isomerase